LNVGLAIASVVMLVLSQSPNDLGPLATVALVPWLVTVSRSGAVSAAVMSVGIGVAYAVLGMPWLSAAFHSQGVDGFHGVLGVLMTALWAKGLLFGVVGWIAQRLRGRNNIVRVSVPAVVFGLAEYGASHSALGLPLLLVGHSQHSVPGVAQLAVVVGVPGITVLLFLVNAALASALIDGLPGIRVAFAVSGAWWTVAIGGLPIAHAFEPAVRSRPRTLLLVQPNIVPGRRWDAAFQGMILDETAAETSRALMEVERSPDAILWPENLLTFPATRDNRLGHRLRDYVNRWETPVVLGFVREIVGGDADRYRNSAV
jgi:apolipoprotein N-acyltransferase